MITVLSPHRDDAVFSLGIALAQWSQAEIPLRVINIFTVSEYAPRTGQKTRDEITTIRRDEDHQAIAGLSERIEIVDLHALDAPIRRHVRWEQITDPNWIHGIDEGEVNDLALQLRSVVDGGAVLAPLALGDHIDHHVVNRAARYAFRSSDLAFYEDLPYASFLNDKEIAQRAARFSATRPAYVRRGSAVEDKRQMALQYASQINDADAERIAGLTLRYSGGERIWISSGDAPEGFGHRPVAVGPGLDWNEISSPS